MFSSLHHSPPFTFLPFAWEMCQKNQWTFVVWTKRSVTTSPWVGKNNKTHIYPLEITNSGTKFIGCEIQKVSHWPFLRHKHDFWSVTRQNALFRPCEIPTVQQWRYKGRIVDVSSFFLDHTACILNHTVETRHKQKSKTRCWDGNGGGGYVPYGNTLRSPPYPFNTYNTNSHQNTQSSPGAISSAKPGYVFAERRKTWNYPRGKNTSQRAAFLHHMSHDVSTVKTKNTKLFEEISIVCTSTRSDDLPPNQAQKRRLSIYHTFCAIPETKMEKNNRRQQLTS